MSKSTQDDSESFTSDSELDELNTEDFLNEISDIDAKIVNVRFSENLSNDQIIDKLSSLMERRNHLQDKLQSTKAKEFRNFIESMNLHEINVKPFYPAPGRCRLQVNDKLVNEMMEFRVVEEEKTLNKFINFFKKKNDEINADNESKSDAVVMLEKYHDYMKSKNDELEKEKKYFNGKKYLSPEDNAKKLRVEAELKASPKYDKIKRK